MKKLVLSILLFFSMSATATDIPLDSAPCQEGPLAQFGRYVGDWRIADEKLSSDGSSWGPGTAERWIFECIGNGVAVQDYWLPQGGTFGTNLRTYNPDTGKWEIVWAANGLNGLSQITAELNDDDDIVMRILSPKFPQLRRIIFFAPDADGWNWVQQWSFDDGATWMGVYRIRATPWAD